MDKYDKYLKVVGWAKNRYSYRIDADHTAVDLYNGHMPSKYTRIELMAAKRYLGATNLLPMKIEKIQYDKYGYAVV